MHVRITDSQHQIARNLAVGTLLEIDWADEVVAYLKTSDRWHGYVRLDTFQHASTDLCDKMHARVIGRLVAE